MMDYLNLAYAPEAEIEEQGYSKTEIGELVLVSGKIVACDLMDDLSDELDSAAYTRQVPAGSYPVSLIKDDEDTTGLVVIKFSDKTAVSWEMAIIPEQNLADLEEDELFGFEVESGFACLMDEKAITLMMANEKAVEAKLGNDFSDYYEDVIADEMAANDDDWCLHQPDPNQPANILVYNTMGDGYFAAYWGLDSKGEVVSLVTDLGIFYDGDEEDFMDDDAE